MKGGAYWINPYGKILNSGSYELHIKTIVDNPKQFGLTDSYVKGVYKKYDELVGSEGRAREQLISDVLKKGFVRVRLYINRYWSVTVHGFTPKTKKSLAKWAEHAKEDRSAGPHMPVSIVDIKSGRVNKKYTVQDLYFDKHINENEVLPDFHPEFVLNLPEYRPDMGIIF